MPVSQLPPADMIREKSLFSAAPPAVATAVVFGLGVLTAWVVFGVLLKWNWRKAVPSLAVLSLAAGLAAVPLLFEKVEEARAPGRAAIKAQKAAIDDAPGDLPGEQLQALKDELEALKERDEKLATAYPFQETFPLVPDGKWWHWGLLAIGLALLVEFAASLPGVPVGVGHLFRGVAAGVIASAVLPPDWQKGVDRWLLPFTAAVMAVLWGMLDAVSRRNPGGTHAVCLSVVALGAACVAIHDDQGRFTDFATFLAVSLGVLALGGWVLRADTGSAAAVAVVPIMTVLLMTRESVPQYEPEWMSHPPVPALAYWLVGLAPAVLGLFLVPPVTRFGTRWYSIPVKLLLVAIPVAIAVYLCVTEAPMSFDQEKW